MLASVVRAARFDLVAGHAVMPVHRVTLRPGDGLPMTLRLRDAGSRARPVPAELSSSCGTSRG